MFLKENDSKKDKDKEEGKQVWNQKAHGKFTCLKISTAMLLVTIETVEYICDRLFFHYTDYAVV